MSSLRFFQAQALDPPPQRVRRAEGASPRNRVTTTTKPRSGESEPRVTICCRRFAAKSHSVNRFRRRFAEAADVPVGNVYYYFKTKDDLKMAFDLAQTLGRVPDITEVAERLQVTVDDAGWALAASSCSVSIGLLVEPDAPCGNRHYARRWLLRDSRDTQKREDIRRA